MKLNKYQNNNLLTHLFRQFLIQCSIITIVTLIVTGVLYVFAEWFIRQYWPDGYYYYRALYLAVAAVVVWTIQILVCTHRLLRRVVQYVDELQKATEQLFDKNVAYIELSPELSEIAAKINRLKQESERNERLAKENEQRKNDLIMYLAHDLKTPLSSVIGYLTLLHDEGQISPELREKYLAIALDKAERLEDLINEFFEITRFNLSEITLHYSQINLTRLLEQLSFEFKPMLAEKNLTCELQAPEDIILNCDADKIQRVFDNLLLTTRATDIDDLIANTLGTAVGFAVWFAFAKLFGQRMKTTVDGSKEAWIYIAISFCGMFFLHYPFWFAFKVAPLIWH